MKRNIILLSITVAFILLITMLRSFVYDNKYDDIVDLEDEQKIANEKYITAQILSDESNFVYNLFEKNLAKNSNDELNQQSSSIFMNNLTDIFEKLSIRGVNIRPGKKYKKDKFTYIPYELEFNSDYPRFGRLLIELAASERIIKINEFKFLNTPDLVRRGFGRNKLPDAKITMEIATITLNK